MTLKQIGCIIVLVSSLLLAILTVTVGLPEIIAITAAFGLIAILAGVSLL